MANRSRASQVEDVTRRGGSGRRALYTIGHSTRPANELIDILRAFAVTRLADIRSIPRSRTNPQFNIDVLPETLRPAGISYVHLPALGGRRTRSACVERAANAAWERRPFHNYADYAETAPFREGLRDLLMMASRQTCAIMCAEAVWWRCHRRIVTDHVLAHGGQGGTDSMLRIKRTYDLPTRGDGRRFLVERLWPRGMKKEALVADAWMKEVAPSAHRRRWFGHRVERWEEFRRRYREELDANPGSWAPILDAERRGTVTLLYSAHDVIHNGAVVLRDFLVECKARSPGRGSHKVDRLTSKIAGAKEPSPAG